MHRRVRFLAWTILALMWPAVAAADTAVRFTGTVTAIVESEGFFEAPGSVAVGSAVTGLVSYPVVPDGIYDPEPSDCKMGYLFETASVVIEIEGRVWDYNFSVVRVENCESYDLVEYDGQAAVSYPPTAPAHILMLKLYDQIAPFTLIDSQDLPLGEAEIDLGSLTRASGRVLNDTWGEIRFDVETVTYDGGVPVEPVTWGGVKALFLR